MIHLIGLALDEKIMCLFYGNLLDENNYFNLIFLVILFLLHFFWVYFKNDWQKLSKYGIYNFGVVIQQICGPSVIKKE